MNTALVIILLYSAVMTVVAVLLFRAKKGPTKSAYDALIEERNSLRKKLVEHARQADEYRKEGEEFANTTVDSHADAERLAERVNRRARRDAG